MARKSKKVLEDETAATAETAPDASSPTIEIIDDSAELVDPAPRKKPRRRPKQKDRVPPTEDELKAAEPRRFLVKRGGRILHRGNITLLREGKVIKEGGYNIQRLRDQGCLLEEVKE